MLLTVLKKSRERDAHLKAGKGWRDPALTGTYIGRREDGYEGLTIGIIGLGRIGSRFSRFMTPWNVRLIAYDPYVADEHFRRARRRARRARYAVARIGRRDAARHPDEGDVPHDQRA